MPKSASKLYKERCQRSGKIFSQISVSESGYWDEVNAQRLEIISAIQSSSFPDPSSDKRHFEFARKKYSIIEDDDGNRYVRRRKAYTTDDPILSSGSYSKVDIGIMVPNGWTKAKGTNGLQMFSINKHHEDEDKEEPPLKKNIEQKVQQLGIGLPTTTLIRNKRYHDDTTIKKVYEIQPLGECLWSCIGQNKLNNDQKCSIAAQLAIIMGKMKSETLYHRDLKPENIMIMWHGEKPTVKLIDFDFAAIGAESLEGGAAGTKEYIPSLDRIKDEFKSNGKGTEGFYTLQDEFAFGRVLGDMGIDGDIPEKKETVINGNEENTVPHTRIFSDSGIPYERIAVKYIFSELGIIINIWSVLDLDINILDIDRKIVFAILAIYDAGIRDKDNIEKLLGDDADAKAKVEAINKLVRIKELLSDTLERYRIKDSSDTYFCNKKIPKLSSLLDEGFNAKFIGVLQGDELDTSEFRSAFSLHRCKVCSLFGKPESFKEYEKIVSPEE